MSKLNNHKKSPLSRARKVSSFRFSVTDCSQHVNHRARLIRWFLLGALPDSGEDMRPPVCVLEERFDKLLDLVRPQLGGERPLAVSPALVDLAQTRAQYALNLEEHAPLGHVFVQQGRRLPLVLWRHQKQFNQRFPLKSFHNLVWCVCCQRKKSERELF